MPSHVERGFLVDNATGAIVVSGSGGGGGLLSYTIPGALALGAGQVRLYAPRAGSILGVSFGLSQAPGLGSVIADVNRNGTTIFSTQANRPRCDVGELFSGVSVPDVPAVALGDYLTVDVDSVGIIQPSFVAAAAASSVSSGTTVSVPRPAGAQAGDLIFVLLQHTVGRTWTPPAGFTQIGSPLSTGGGGGPQEASRFWAIDDGSAGPYVFTANGALTWGAGRSAAWRGIAGPTPVDASSSGAGTFDSTYDFPSLTATEANELLVLWGSGAQAVTVGALSPGITVRTGTNVLIADKQLAAAGATGALSIGVGAGGVDNVAGAVAFKSSQAAAVKGSDLVLTVELG